MSLADIVQEAFAIIIASVGPESEGGVPQASQGAHALAVGGAPKLWVL